MRLSFAYTTAKQMKLTCGRDRSGGAAVPERSGGMEPNGGTVESRSLFISCGAEHRAVENKMLAPYE